MYALGELYPLDPQALYLEHGMRITRAIAKALNQKMDEPDMAGEILTTWCQAANFLLCAQFTEQTMLSRGYDPKVVGAFPRSLDDSHIRIDYVQHSISALLGLHNILAGFDEDYQNRCELDE